MSSPVLCAVILLVCALALSAAQTSCKGRCGVEYYRGYMCQCDYGCLPYGECCKDYEGQCTTKNSCKGRCGESFRRGRLCSCDSDCIKYKQCCPDYKTHCDAEEEMSGAASATAPVKCDNLSDNKPKEPTVNEATEPTITEGNEPDENLIPLVSLTSYPADGLSDGMDSQVSPNQDGDLEASPVPESTSGYGSSTADLLDQMSAEPTQYPDAEEFSTETFTILSQTQTTLADDEPTQASGEALTESTDVFDASSSSDQGTTLPQPTTSADHISNQPTTAPQTEYPPTSDATENEGVEQLGVDALPEDLTVAPTVEPEATTLPSNTAPYTSAAPATSGSPQESSTFLENSQVTTNSASTLDQTPIPEETTPNPEPDVSENSLDGLAAGTSSPLEDLQDPSTSVPPAGSELDALTTSTPSSTAAGQDDTSEDFTPVDTTADLLNVTPDPTKPTPSEDPSTPQDKPDTYKPSPTKPTPDKPTPAKLTPAKPSPAKPTPAKPTPDKPTPAKLTPAKPTPDKPTPAKLTPAKLTPAKLTPAKPTPDKPTPAKPGSKPETKPLDGTLTVDDTREYQADDNNDTDLCSGRPVSGVTTLRNGTMVVFRGHYFWVLDRNMVPGPARGITQVWGVPSPIDTVFTRCNCQGKTYIFKGSKYWRYENDVLDNNYPKVVETGFDGLRGHITAALSVPQYQSRRESVYFFKRGGLVQKYSYQFGTSPTCGRKVQYAVYTVRNRRVRQVVSLLEPAVNIRTSWRGFPSTITAAVSVPNSREPEGYKYHVFSRSKSYSVRMDGERPVIAAPSANASPQSNNFFKCSKKV